MVGLEVVIALDQLSDHHGRETYPRPASATLRKEAVFCHEDGVRQPVSVVINTIDGGSGSDVTGLEAL